MLIRSQLHLKRDNTTGSQLIIFIAGISLSSTYSQSPF